MADLRGAQRLRDGRDLTKWQRARLAVRTCDDERQLLQICCTLPRLGGKAHVHLARLVAWIAPIARLDSGERWTQCLGDLADRHPESPREPTIQLDVELRLLPFGR